MGAAALIGTGQSEILQNTNMLWQPRELCQSPPANVGASVVVYRPFAYRSGMAFGSFFAGYGTLLRPTILSAKVNALQTQRCQNLYSPMYCYFLYGTGQV